MVIFLGYSLSTGYFVYLWVCDCILNSFSEFTPDVFTSWDAWWSRCTHQRASPFSIGWNSWKARRRLWNSLTVTTYFLQVPLLNVIFHENDPCLAFSVQRKAMESCVEILIVKLLHATKDAALKVIHLMLVSACISWCNYKAGLLSFKSLSLQVVY